MVEESERIEDFSDDERWSYSKLEIIHSCGYKYYLHYIENAVRQPNAAMQFGSAVHLCIDKIHKESIDKEDIPRLWLDQWNEYSKSVDWNKETTSRLIYKNRGLKILEQYLEKPQYNVIESEVKFETDIYRGIIDRIVEIQPGELAVIDFKTSKWPPNHTVLRRDYQLTGYRLGANSLGYDIKHYAIYHLLSGELYWTYRDDNDVQSLYDNIEEAERKVQAEMYLRNVGYQCKSCSFLEQCLGSTGTA